MNDFVAAELRKDVRTIVQQNSLTNHLLFQILCVLQHPPRPTDRVNGGYFKETAPMVPISPGNSPKFQVSPTFSGEPFVLDGTKVTIASSDPTNFPVALDPTDPEGRTFIADIPADAQVPPAIQPPVVTWQYTNTDGITATVVGTVTEVGIVDDVTGGTFAQVA